MDHHGKSPEPSSDKDLDQGTKMPLVSVVIANYNSGHYLREAVDSIVRQDYAGPVEILIADDASTDESKRIAEAYERVNPAVSVYQMPRNSGAAAARNTAIKQAKGDYVLIQDADDISEPSRISVLLRELEKTPSVAFVSSGHTTFDELGAIETSRPSRSIPDRRAFLWGTPFVHGATMFRTSALRSVGMYRVAPETRRGQDYDLFMRLYAAGHSGLTVPYPLYRYRLGSEAYRRRTLASRIDGIRVRWKGFQALGLLPFGIFHVMKPLPAHLLNYLRLRKSHLRTRG